ncbi:fasciclin domain-containing protein [Terrimonas sp. NA20]|uniref:Fasciclin domain-containing protein n=1 Tax=Terrimonas ginsenosidimutans TaxID=2908004 RepID=A0ABS9KS27_9BACT|nr:fasciclin domain-containing protein [Terrimonas ginsenosidimutans]MCG2615136.1 fasciclin domain-containing protein [Terrimonas ginsenosidimutans]
MSNIVDVVVADRNLATMLRSVKAAGLVEELNKTGPFTVFAPTDLAFGKMAAGELGELLRPHNKAKLTILLNHHIVNGRQYFDDLKDGQQLKTIDGDDLLVTVRDGSVSINGSVIQGRDMEASNGVVHSLSKLVFGA